MLNISSMKFQSEDLKDLYFILPVASIFSLVAPFKCVPDLCARRSFFRGIHVQPSGFFSPKLLSILPQLSVLAL